MLYILLELNLKKKLFTSLAYFSLRLFIAICIMFKLNRLINYQFDIKWISLRPCNNCLSKSICHSNFSCIVKGDQIIWSDLIHDAV
jgi:hypothetical protein